MARLNEPPQPATESIDALKRRFVRQNREIARANSTQSVRIRNLECEVSRLLGENVSLREEIIRLQHEVEKNTSKHVLEGVDTVKVKLEAKLSELGTLLRELGDVRKTNDIQRTQKRRSISRSSPKGSPDQRIWKNTLTLSEAFGGAEGRLPPIVEDKYYPRRTLDAEELLGIVTDPANITDSPDLGPPPVAHFEQGDPIKFDPGQNEPLRQDWIVNAEESNQNLSANLETRKKRRESSHRRNGDVGRSNLDSARTSSAKEALGVDQPLKSGAKRKLNVRDDGETPEPIENRDNNGELSNSRGVELTTSERGDAKPITTKASKSINSKALLARPLSTQIGKEKPIAAPASSMSSNRKALGPKSVNSDPMNSPLKHSRANSKDKVVDAKDDFARIVRDRNRPKEKSQIKAASQSNAEFNVAAAPTSRVKSMEIPPETLVPPADDLFSPGLSEPSAPRADSRDTPPPPELGPDTGTGSFGRASRRPKGNVNYAQPNLRDKMRRRTAELVDAVAAEERARQASIAKAEKEASKAVVVKQEDATEGLPVWKTNEPKESDRTLEEPASPLSSKTGESSKDLPSTIITERRRRTNVHVGVEEVNGLAKGTSGAASAIVALTSGSHRPWRNEEERAEKALPEDEEKHEPTERPSIYDFTGSSPNNGFNDEEIRGNAETAKPTRSSRRHSTVAASSDQSKGTLSISRRGDRRREGVLGGREERQDEGAGTDTLPPSARTKSVLQLRDGGEESAMGRGERAASRRRSMML